MTGSDCGERGGKSLSSSGLGAHGMQEDIGNLSEETAGIGCSWEAGTE